MESVFSKNIVTNVFEDASSVGLRTQVRNYLSASTFYFIEAEYFFRPTAQDVEGNITGIYTCYLHENNGLVNP